ncbi:MAG TPA: AsmA family protein, partial [Alphaproteobacteria bacterium]
MKRVILVILAALVIFAGILVVMPSFIDWGKYRGQIVAQMENATGHRYDIGGAISMAVLPFPHLVVEKLAIAPTQDGAPNIAAADSVEVSVALMPLFKGEIVVNSVVLVNPDIRLSIAADGTQSWMTPVLQARMEKKNANGGGNMADAVALNDIRIENGAFTYADMRSRKSYELKEINVALHGDTLLGPYDAEGGFTYNGQKIEAEIKTGKMGGGSDSLAVQAELKVPVTATALSWSGVVATGEAFEIQGETSIETANAGALAALSGGKSAAGFDKNLSLKGILTASKTQASFTNMKMSYGGVSAAGSFTIAELDGAVPAITAELAADGPVDAGLFMPAPSKQAAPKEKDFIPETFVLPRDVTAKFGLSAPQVTYGGKTYRNLKLAGSYADKALKYNVSAGTPGTGAFDSEGALTFASASRAGQAGAVTLSDPTLSYSMNFSADKAEEAVKQFVPSLPVKGRMTAHAKGTVTPKRVTVDSANINALNMPVALAGSFAPGPRNKAALSVSAEDIDFDRLMPPPAVAADGKTPAKPATLQETAHKLVLPFDLDLKWNVGHARMKGKDYSDLSGRATLNGKKLQLESFAGKDAQGNTVNAAGTVGDVAALKDIDMTVEAATDDMPALIAQFTGKPASLPQGVKSGSVVAALKGQPDNLGFTANLRAVNGTLDVSGALADVLVTPVVSDLTLRLKHPNYVDVARLFAPDFKSGVAIKKSLDVFATMKRDGARYSFTGLQAEIGPA